ncbi:MAG: DUF3179 domain-containing protein [Halobacteriales archaeon]
MDRRRFLAGAVTGLSAAWAGCVGARVGSPEAATAQSSQGTETPVPTVEEVAGTSLPLSEEALTRGAPKDAIPAIVDPAFAPDWSDLEITFINRYGNEKVIQPRLNDEDRVIGVSRQGSARAYPLKLLNWHEVVNDVFGGPLLVTFCPLCGSGVTAERRVQGEPTVFGVSGLLWNSDLVMYDELTESLWSQIAGAAVRGPMTGQRLKLVPSTITTWETWRTGHPDTQVLLPPPESSTVQGDDAIRNYTRSPYALYEDSEQIGIGANEVPDSEVDLHPKTQVLGVTDGDAARAYPLEAVAEAGIVNERVGDRPVVVTATADDETVVGYIRTVDGSVLRFERASQTHLLAGGSRWEISTGRAVDGPHEGTQLRSASKRGQLFWFAWLDFHPNTTVYTGSGEE